MMLDIAGHCLTYVVLQAATMQIIRWTDGGFGMAC